MKISDIKVKDKSPFRAYFNRTPIWWKCHERTQAIFDYANERYYQLPTKRLQYDDLVRGLVNNDLFHTQNDVLYNYAADGDANFKLINMPNPGTYNATAYGGLEWSAEGVKGNNVNGYIDTNFDPSLLVEGQKYQLNDAAFGGVIYGQPSSGNIQRIFIGSNAGTGFTLNLIIANNTAQNRVNSRTNIETGQVLAFAGTGFTLLSRNNPSSITAVKKEIVYEMDQPAESLESSFRILSSGILYSDQIVSSIIIGSVPTFEQTQTFRQIYNKYLSSIGLEPIA